MADKPAGDPSPPAPKLFKYAAFISYRHGGEDERVAKWLIRELESYRLPTEVARPRKLPRKIGKCFRDVDELRGESSLEGALLASLTKSRWLVAICSPRYRQSRYCGEEVKAFHDMGRHNRILALVISGEPGNINQPDDPFRPELRTYQNIIKRDGAKQVQEVRVEPLAADLRPKPGISNRTARQVAKLKIISALIECDYDELFRRERRRARRKTLQFVASFFLLLFVVSGLALGIINANKAKQNALLAKARSEQHSMVLQTQATAATRESAAQRKQRHTVELLSKARDLCKASVNESQDNPELAALLALQAYRLEQKADLVSLTTGELTSTLDAALRKVMGRTSFCASLPCPPNWSVAKVAASGDGRYAAGVAVEGPPDTLDPKLMREAFEESTPEAIKARAAVRAHILVWDISKGRAIGFTEIPLRSPSDVIAFASTGDSLGIGAVDGSVRIVDAANPAVDVRAAPAGKSPVIALAVGAEGKVAAAGCADGSISRIDFQPPHPPLTLVPGDPSGNPDILKAAFNQWVGISPDGRYVGQLHKRIRLWDTSVTPPVEANPQTNKPGENAGKTLEQRLHSTHSLVTAAFSDSGTLKALDASGELETWNISDIFGDKPYPIKAAPPEQAFESFGYQLSVISPGATRVILWNKNSGSVTWEPAYPKATYQTGPVVCPYSPSIAAAGEDHVVVNNPEARPMLCTYRRDSAWIDPIELPSEASASMAAHDPAGVSSLVARESGQIEGIQFNPAGKRLTLVDSGSQFESLGSVQHAWTWDLQRGRTKEPIPNAPAWKILSSTSQFAAALLGGKDVKQIAKVTGGANAVVGYSPDGRFLVAGSGQQIHAWQTSEATGPGSVFTCARGAIHAIAMHPQSTGDGFSFVVGAENGEVNLWSCTSAGLTATAQLLAGKGNVRAIAYSRQGEWLACGGDDPTPRLWGRVPSQSKPILLIGHMGPINSLAFDHPGHRLATGSTDGTVRIWDPLRPGKALRTISPGRGAIRALTFDATDEYLLVACNTDPTEPDGRLPFKTPGARRPPGILYFYDLTPGHENFPPAEMAGEYPEITSLLLSPDGICVAAACADSTVRFWIASPAALIRLAEGAVGRNLTLAEWDRFVGHPAGIPYERTCRALASGS